MKYVMVVLGGAADRPVRALYDKTPLQAARLPVLDDLGREGLVGSVRLLADEAPFCPEAAAMALLGYNPARYFTGAGPLDAMGRYVPLGHSDVAYRLDLVSCDGETLSDPAAGGISGAQAEALFQEVASRLRSRWLQFYPGRGRRHVLVWVDGPLETLCLPPAEAKGKPLAETMPQGEGETTLRTLMFDSMEILDGHEINQRRRDAGEPPANMVWPWAPGRAPVLPSFVVQRGLGGAVISAAAYWRGLARLAGLEAPEVPGATGRIETNYAGKVETALRLLDQRDFVLVHLGAPGAASAQGDADMKVDALQRADARLLAPLLKGVRKLDDYRLMVLPDITFSVEERALRRDPVPFLLSASLGLKQTRRVPFDETAVTEAPLQVDEGERILDVLLE
ncbi:MAG: 2,3-bisphosphoglycerate-independent phosphoglycerate mutase [Armatimonadota bacterium]|nr:2,3-bisphosphoglycerate-independent phosphoglycerate mutase [Armatimonadota bacterium]